LHNFFGGLQQYGHQVPLFTSDIFLSNVCAQISQKKEYILHALIAIFLGFSVLSNKYALLGCETKLLAKQD
jgi:hypothetical protein